MFASTTTVFKALSLAVLVALGAPGCVMDGDPAAAPDEAPASEELEVELGEAAAVELGEAADVACGEATEQAPGVAVPSCCSRPYGCPVPVPQEPRFLSCRVSCQNAGHPPADCHRTCCSEITGCSLCYIQ